MADFKQAYNKVAKVEEGYQCDPDDNGNWTGGKKGIGQLVGTKYGITAPEMHAFLHRVPTVEDMKNMSPATAEAIFKSNYWDVVRGDDINNQEEAERIFDSAVNMGTGTAIKLAKISLGLDVNTHADDSFINSLNGKI
ncbi:MAG TPA: glycosyl hydrolase 108 family protein [Chitinophagaceae bacterium]|nr:glycosyl hydrolase 108 family protein [Chitinophagaceae bacterium]